MPSLSDAVLEDLRFRVVQGFENRELTFDWLLMNYPADLGITADPYDASDLDAETTALLRNAIEQAFREKEKEAESWRRPNDYDRLLTAFAALDQQGIVALECPGLMQGDSVTCAVELAAVRDELGGVEAHGYCFFAWNDMARAIDGDGLSLAYGTFESEPEAPPIASPPPTLCPLCKGRGWIAPVDATQFPTTCSCRTLPLAETPAPPAPPPTRGQKVGALVFQACTAAGLDVEWEGRPEAYVELPRFRWQRRMVVTQESDVRDFLDGWEIELRAGYSLSSVVVPARQTIPGGMRSPYALRRRCGARKVSRILDAKGTFRSRALGPRRRRLR